MIYNESNLTTNITSIVPFLTGVVIFTFQVNLSGFAVLLSLDRFLNDRRSLFFDHLKVTELDRSNSKLGLT